MESELSLSSSFPSGMLYFFFFKFLFVFRGGEEGEEKGKEGDERERNMSVWLPLACPQLGT